MARVIINIILIKEPQLIYMHNSPRIHSREEGEKKKR